MSKHTPGPWTNLPRHECVPICRQDEAGLSIGFVHSSDPERIAEGFANAKLIAAAPDLLVAAQRTVDARAAFINSFNYTPGIGDMAEDMEFRELLSLRAAIAKATQ